MPPKHILQARINRFKLLLYKFENRHDNLLFADRESISEAKQKYKQARKELIAFVFEYLSTKP